RPPALFAFGGLLDNLSAYLIVPALPGPSASGTARSGVCGRTRALAPPGQSPSRYFRRPGLPPGQVLFAAGTRTGPLWPRFLPLRGCATPLRRRIAAHSLRGRCRWPQFPGSGLRDAARLVHDPAPRRGIYTRPVTIRQNDPGLSADLHKEIARVDHRRLDRWTAEMRRNGRVVLRTNLFKTIVWGLVCWLFVGASIVMFTVNAGS